MYEVSEQPKHNHAGISGILTKLDKSAYSKFTNMLKIDVLNPSNNRARLFAIAAVVIDPADESKFLAVKRPTNAKSLPDVWGLPAITLRPDEQPETATARLASEKLNTQVELVGCLGFASADRGEYELTLMDIVVRLVGKEPSVREAPTEQTKYVEQRWTDDLSILREAALRGSVCSRILLQSQDITY